MVRQRITLTSFTKEEIHRQILCLISDALFSSEVVVTLAKYLYSHLKYRNVIELELGIKY